MDNPIWTARRIRFIRFRRWVETLIGIEFSNLNILDFMYLLYVLVFFTLWTFAVLAFLGNGTASIIQVIPADERTLSIIYLISFILLAWMTYQLIGALRRSPLSFTSEDAQLICQTPVSRRALGLIWLIADWPISFAPLAVIVSVLGLALFDEPISASPNLSLITEAISVSIRLLVSVAVIHFGLLLLTWNVGALRLSRWKRYWAFSLAFVPLALFFPLLRNLYFSYQNKLLDPFFLAIDLISVPIQTVLLGGDFIYYLLAPGIVAFLSLMIFIWLSSKINLSRAAQETADRMEFSCATRMGIPSYAQDLRMRSLKPIRTKALTTRFILVDWLVIYWRDLVRHVRRVALGNLYAPAQLFIIIFAIIAIPVESFHIWAAFFTILLIGEIANSHLQGNLEYWWLEMQLPLGTSKLLAGEALFPIVSTTLILTIAFIAGQMGRSDFPFFWLYLLPFLSATIVFCAFFEVLRKAKTDAILSGQIPGPGPIFLVLSSVFVAIPIGLMILSSDSGLAFSLCVGIGSSLACLVTSFRLGIHAFRRLQSST